MMVLPLNDCFYDDENYDDDTNDDDDNNSEGGANITIALPDGIACTECLMLQAVSCLTITF